MYQVVTEMWIDGKREMDSICTKIYVRKRWAERQAHENTGVFKICDDRLMEKKSYVRGMLRPVSMLEARSAYCKCRRIWIDGDYGQIKIPNSWEYGSHASAEELFHRSVNQSGGYGYNGNYYIEYKEY